MTYNLHVPHLHTVEEINTLDFRCSISLKIIEHHTDDFDGNSYNFFRNTIR